MRISEAFPSRFLKAGDLNGREYKLTMSRVEIEDLNGEMKPILYFHGAEKGLVLNKTNAEMIALMFGDETNSWSGQPIVIKPDKTQMQGKIVDCIRVVWQGGRGHAPAPGTAQVPLGNAAPAPAGPSGTPMAGMGDPLDDSIPFAPIRDLP